MKHTELSPARCSHLSQLLHEHVEPLALCLGVGGHRAAVLQFGLQLQQPAHVVGLFTGRLLQQRLLVALAILRHLALLGIGLAKRLWRGKTREEYILEAGLVCGTLKQVYKTKQSEDKDEREREREREREVE